MSSISITSESQADRVEHLSRLFARRVALGLALSRADLTAAARAAGRIRLSELGISAEEKGAARFARATLGRAIRDARARTLRAPAKRAALRSAAIAAPQRSRSRPAIFAAIATAVALVVLFVFLGSPGGPLTGVRASGDSRSASSQQVLDDTKQSRGRTGQFTQQVAVGAPTGTIAPVASPRPTLEPGEGRGGGGGGGGGGSGSGGVGLVPVPPIIPPPTPTPIGYVRFHGRVIDATTGLGVQGVCVVIGSLNCAADKPHSDSQGFWSVVVTSQPYWDFGWQLTGYRSVQQRLYSYGRDDVAVEDVKLSR